MQKYLTEQSKTEIIKILTEEYEKILISESISKSNKSTLQKQEIKEFINYLQNNQNITYANLSKLNEKVGLGWLGKIAKLIGLGGAQEVGGALTPMSFDSYGIVQDPFVGPGGQGSGGWNPAEHGYPRPEELEPDFIGPPYYGPDNSTNQPPQNLPENKYLSEQSKTEIIKILTEEYEKILIYETISKSKRSTIEKQQIAEIVDYLQNNQNVTYADLSKLNESLWKILGKIGKKFLGPVGTALDVWDAGTQAYELYKELTRPRPGPPPPIPLPGGGNIPAQAVPIPGIGQVFGGGLRETTIKIPENLPESMKTFWKDRLMEKINL